MGEEFEKLKAGSDAYNQDRKNIEWLIKFLIGLMEKERELPHCFTVNAWLFSFLESGQDTPYV